MHLINNIDEVYSLINSFKKSNNLNHTNFFPSNEKLKLQIESNSLYYQMIDKNLIFFIRDFDFYHVFYLFENIEKLNIGLQSINSDSNTYVIDVLGKKDYLDSIINDFNKSGFNQYISLVRMNMIIKDSGKFESLISDASYATKEDTEQIYEIIQKSFDKFAEQLPPLFEIALAINKKNILVIKVNEKIVGFLYFELTGLTSYLRIWFVDSNYRNMKIGSRLMNKYFNLSSKARRFIFWVISTNENAINRYEHYGYSKENLYDYVFINKDLRYNGENS